MKTRLLLFSLLGAALLPGAALIRGSEGPPTPAPERELAVVIVEDLQSHRSAISAFDRLDMAFQKLARERKWPLKLKVERFAANTPAHAIELRIFNQPVRQELPGELTFRGWMMLTVNGEKHDFGIVTYRMYPRALEDRDDVLAKVFDGAARAAAEKFEPILLPKADAPKT